VDERTRKSFLMWTKTEEYHSRICEAEEIIRKAYEKISRPFVSFSGGKDSTVMLHLVLQQDSNVLVLHWDYGRYYMPREIEAEILANAQKIGAKNIRVETSIQYEKQKRKAVNVIGRDLIGRIMPKMKAEGYDCCFLGLRAEESMKRKRRTKTWLEYHGEHVAPANVFPIRRLKWLDVWGYIVSNGLPYPKIYDLYAPLLGWDKARLVTFFDMEFEKLGSPYVDGFLLPGFRNWV